MQNVRNIVVTGSNKGIGYGIVDHLAKSDNWNIIMACRNLDNANKAKEELLKNHPNAKVSIEQLDVSDSKSIDAFIPTIKDKYKTIDVLVNNAGVAAKGDDFDTNVVDFTFKTNYYGTIELTEKLLPYIRDQGKIVTVGSMAGKMAYKRMTNEELQKKFRKENLNKEELNNLMEEFKNAVSDNSYEQKGWPKWIYGVSKLGINLYCSILGYQKDVLDRGIQVYVCCPGYVATDMTSHKGTLSVDQGIKTPVHLIELPFEVNKDLQGQFFQKEKLSSTFEDIQ